MAERITSALPSRRGVVALMLFALVVSVTAAVCQVWTRLRAIEYGYKLSKATRAQTELTEANRRLRLEVAVLTNPTRVARIATEELGLRSPAPEQVRRIRWRGSESATVQDSAVARASR